MAIYSFYSDPSHGWIKVPVSKIKKLGIQNQISSFSYLDHKRNYVFLEEDSDAGKFITAMKNIGKAVTFRNMRQSEKRSKIRSYDSYDAKEIA